MPQARSSIPGSAASSGKNASPGTNAVRDAAIDSGYGLFMSMDAVAALKVKLDDAKKTLKAAPGGLVGADGETIRVRALDDGILVDLGVSLRDPDAVALALRQRLGAVLDAHDDPRGVMVFPERARPSAKTYAEVVELLGDLGEWLEPSDDENLQGGPTPDLAAMMGQMLGDPSQMQGLW